jgi:uncharacterized phage protein gp47/JayE
MAQIREITVKDPIEIRDDILRTIKNGLRAQGADDTHVGPNTDWFLMATALGNELAVVGANAIVRADAQMPDTAELEDLARIAALFELAKQAAAGSLGNVVIEASATAPIETGRQLTDAAGLRFEVVVGGNYEDGDPVPIRAIDTGYDTNHAEEDVLQWVSAPPFCSDKVIVDVGGLVNGIDAENDEVLRARLFALLQNPPGAGDPEHVIEIAEASSSSVQKGFCIPAVQGPATLHVAVTAAPTETSKSRVVASALMNGVVEPFIKGKLPTHAHVVVTTVEDVDTDVSFALALPEATTASPPGLGGGWTNGTPWPAPDGVTYLRHTVTAVTSSTVITVDAQTVPTRNVTRIAWLSPFDWKLYTALVTDYSGSAGAYTITLDTAFTDIAAGCYIWPECKNAQTYVDAVLEAFSLMGPGEKTSNVSALIRGFRHPPPNAAWPHQVGPAMLRATTDAGDEVIAAYFLHRTDGITTIAGTAGVMTPEIPAAVSDAPNIYVPRHIGFYRYA